MYLIFDTETTGLPPKNPKAPLSSWPHVLQLAFSLYDEARRPVLEISTLVKFPKDVVVNEKAFAAHSITYDMADKYGMPMSFAMGILKAAVNRATYKVAHNKKFDVAVLAKEAERLGHTPAFSLEDCFCTLKAMAPICAIPPTPAMKKWGIGPYKSPNLQEAHTHCFGVGFEGAHDALVDTRAAAKVFFWLLDNGHVS